jgi:hypothetical protein
MILIARLVRAGDAWMVSGQMSAFSAAVRDRMPDAAEEALHRPEALFRNPAKLEEACRLLAEQRATFADLPGDDLVVVPGHELPGNVDAPRPVA